MEIENGFLDSEERKEWDEWTKYHQHIHTTMNKTADEKLLYNKESST